MLNKKAMSFEVSLIMFSIIILSAAFYNLIISKGTELTIGTTTSTLLELDKEAKTELEFISQSSLYQIYNSIIKLSENSGYSEDQLKECKSWTDSNINKKCLLTKEKLKENLKLYLFNSFNELTKSRGYYTINIEVKENNLVFSFNSPGLKFTKNIVEYVIADKFQKQVNYDLNKFEELFNKYSKEDMLEKCPESLESGLTCKEEKDFLLFEYKKESFYLGNPSNSFKYPVEPIIKFKLKKLQKI